MHDLDTPIQLAMIHRSELLRDAARHRTARIARLAGARSGRRARHATRTEGNAR
jgi:hypothetical protein